MAQSVETGACALRPEVVGSSAEAASLQEGVNEGPARADSIRAKSSPALLVAGRSRYLARSLWRPADARDVGHSRSTRGRGSEMPQYQAREQPQSARPT